LWFVDDHFPGFVACEFVDAENRVHTLADKVPAVITDDLDAISIYPQTGGIRCTVLQRWQEAIAGELVRVSIDYPDAMETTEGMWEFVVNSAPATRIPRGHREENPAGIWRWVDDE